MLAPEEAKRAQAQTQNMAGHGGDAGRPRRKPPLWRRVIAWLGMGLTLCLVLVLAAVAGLFWWLRTDSAHSFIVAQVNPILTEKLAPQGLDAAITHLDGDLPLSARVGLTVSDARGVWLTVPELRFDLDWSWQDRTVFLRELVCAKPEVARLPDLPTAPEQPEETPPAATPEPEALRQQLNQAGQVLFSLPDWLPRVEIQNIAIENAKVAAAVLGFDLAANLGFKASVAPSFPGAPQAAFALTALNIDSKVVRVRTSLDWKNASDQTTLLPWLNGPLSGSVALEFAPANHAQQEGEQQGLLTETLAQIPPLSKPVSLELALGGTTLAPQVDIQLDALGLEGKVNTNASLPTDNWGQNWATLPRLVADAALHLEHWQDINALAPGLDLSGLVDIKAHAANTDGPLGASLEVNIPRFAMGQQLGLSGFGTRLAVDDVLGAMRCTTRLDVAQIAAAGMKLGSSLKLDGPLAQLLPTQNGQAALSGAQASGISGSEPITLALETHGDVPAKLDARWHMGTLHMPACVVRLPQGTVELAARLNGLADTGQQPSGDFRVVARDIDVRRFVPNLPLEPFDVTLTGKLGKTLEAKVDLPAKTLKTLGADSMKCTASVPLAYAANGVPSPDSKAPLKAQFVWHGQIAPLWALVPQADRRLKGRLDMDVQVAGSMEAPQLKGKLAVGKCRFEDVALGLMLQDMGLNIALDGKMGPDNSPDGQAHLDFVAQDGTGGSLTLKGKSKLDGTGLDMRATLNNLRPLRRHDARVALSGQARVSGEATAPDVRGEIKIDMATILLDNISTGASSVTTLPIVEAPKATTTTAQKKSATAKRTKKVPPAKKSATTAAKPGAVGKRGSLHLDITTPGRIIVDGRGLVSEWKTEMQIRGTPEEPLIAGGLRATKGKLDFMNRLFEITRGTVTFAGGSVANPILDIFLTNTRQGFVSHIAVTGPVQKMQLELSSEPPMPRDEVLSHILFGRNVNELGRLETLQLAVAVAQLAGLGNGGNPLEFTREALGVDVLRVNSGSSGSGKKSGSDNGIGNASVEAGKYLTEDIYIGVQQGAKPNSTAGILELELSPRTRVQVRSEQNNTGAQLNWKMDY